MADIKSVLQETRLFPPPETFARRARIGSLAAYEELYERAERDPDGYWGEVARELYWHRDFGQVLEWKLPDARWFLGGKTNLAYNCLDRHLPERADKTAILWEGEPGEVVRLSFSELHRQVCAFSNALIGLGVMSGDRVAIYMPMIPEAVVAT